MMSIIHADLEDPPANKERASRDMRIAVMSGRALTLPSVHLDMWEEFF